jgi:MFS family permease
VLLGIGALPAGWLGDKWSTLGMMVVFFVGMGVAAIFTGMMSSPLGLAVGLGLIGLFASIYHPVGMAWLVRNAENRGKALGFNGVFGSLGFASAALIAGVLTDLINWRAAFIIPGSVSLITGAALLLCMRSGLVVDTKSDIKPQPTPHRGAMVRAFMVLSITMLCTGLIYQSIATALPKIFAERAAMLTGGTTIGAGALVSVVYLCGMGAQLLGGHLADRYSMRSLYLLAFLLQAPLLFLAAFVNGVPMFVVMTAAVLFSTVAIPVENSLLSHYSPEKWRGTAFGAKFVLALGVSALSVPLVAFIHDVTGSFYWLFILLTLFALMIVAMSLLLPEDKQAKVVVLPSAGTM